MVEITLLEVDLADAEFNAPFARSRAGESMGGGRGGGEPIGGLGRVIGEMARSRGGEPSETSPAGEETLDAGTEAFEGDTPGRGMSMVGAFFALLVVGWLVRRALRRGSTEERLVEPT